MTGDLRAALADLPRKSREVLRRVLIGDQADQADRDATSFRLRRYRARTALACVVGLLLASGARASSTIAESAAAPTSSVAPVTTTTAPSTATPMSAPPCLARWLRVHAGRQGGGLQSAHGDVVFTNTATSACELHGLPKVALLRADGTALSIVPFSEVRPDLARWGLTLRSVVLAPGRHGRASLTLSWQNWCGGRLGALEIAVTLPHGRGTVTGLSPGLRATTTSRAASRRVTLPPCRSRMPSA